MDVFKEQTNVVLSHSASVLRVWSRSHSCFGMSLVTILFKLENDFYGVNSKDRILLQVHD